MAEIYLKLLEARKRLGVTQQELQERLKISQADISNLENGKRVFIWNEYLEFLAVKGIDLNSIFDPRAQTATTIGESAGRASPAADCQLCGEKDGRISSHHLQTKTLANSGLARVFNFLGIIRGKLFTLSSRNGLRPSPNHNRPNCPGAAFSNTRPMVCTVPFRFDIHRQ